MDLPPNFVGMSERQQLRYLSEQAEAANKPPEPVAAGSPFQLVSTGVTNFCPAEPVKKKKPKKRPRAFVVESILDKRVCLDTVLPCTPLQSVRPAFSDEQLLRRALSATCRSRCHACFANPAICLI